MSRFDESYQDRRERERAERREYEADAFYEAWRSGVNPDRVSYERIDDAYYAGREPESIAHDIQRLDRRRREEQEQAELRQAEEEYYRNIVEGDA